MRHTGLLLTAATAVLVTGLNISPARADADDWGNRQWRQHEWREHVEQENAWRRHEWREHYRQYPSYYSYGYYYAPPAYYVPPTYYAVPQVTYGYVYP